MPTNRPDAATEQFLQAVRAAGRPPWYELPVGVARAGTRAANQQMARPPVELPRIEDRRIPTSAGELAVRLYWPRRVGAQESLPIVLYFHGGGFVLCDIDTHDAIARHLCWHGDSIVINVDYRLAPEHKFPAAVDDAYAALCWASAHARDLGGGSVPLIAVAGDSAGGNLAAVVSQLAKSNGGPNVAFQVLLYPVVELDPSVTFASRQEFGGGEYFLSTRDMEYFTSLYLEDATQVQDPRVSPLRSRDLSGLPAALVVTAGCDPLRDEGKMYADRLREAGVPVEYRCFEETIHAFVSFAPAIPAGDEALDFVARRLRAVLRREMTS